MCVSWVRTSSPCYSKDSHKTQQLRVFWNPLGVYMDLCVCLSSFHALLCHGFDESETAVMSGSSVFVEKCLCQSLARVWKIKTRKVSVRRGWSRHKEVKGAGTRPQACQHTHSNTTIPNLTSDPVSWLVLISEKDTTLVGHCYAAHQLSDDIIPSEKWLLYLVSDSVQWLPLHQHPYRDWHRERLG